MSAFHLSRRSVLAGSAAAAAAVSLPAVSGRAQAAAPATVAKSGYRWRNAVMGGTGFVSGVLFHPSVRGLAYARTDIGGAYRWDDRTGRWTPLTDHLGWDDWSLLGVEAMAVDPAHPNRVYLALGTYTQPWAGNGAVLCSEDRGATWKRTDLAVRLGADEDGRGCGERLLVDPGNCDTLWLGTRHDGLLRSTDRGVTWEAVSLPATPSATGQGITLLVAAGRSVYAGWGDCDGTAGTPNLYRTSDGKTWEPVPGQPTGTAAKVPIPAAYDRLTRELYVTYANAPGPNGQSDGSVRKLRTIDGRWSDVTPVKPGGTTADGSTDAFGYGGVAVDARRPGTLVVSTNNRWAEFDTVFPSTDGGRTWKSLKEEAVLDVAQVTGASGGGGQLEPGVARAQVAQRQGERAVSLHRRRRRLHQGRQLPGLAHAGFRQGRQGRLLPGDLSGRRDRGLQRRLPLRRRGRDLDADQRRPAPVGLDRRGHHRRSARPRPRLPRHQRARCAVRGARLMPGLSDATRGRLLFGADCNPEQWPEETWHEDVRLMKAAGVNSVTLGVFPWSTPEPEPGAREFGRLDTLMDLMHANGIGVVLATPASSPPPRMGRLHPDTLPVTEDGRTGWWGGRQHFSHSSATYRRSAAAITEDAGVRPVLDGLPEQVDAVRRGEVLFVLNHSLDPVTVEVPGTHHDLLTGTAVTDRVTLGRYGAAVLRS